MGTSLTGNTVASTYTGLLKTTDNTVLNSSLRTITDGNGNDSSLQISTAAVNSVGNFSVATNKFTVASASGNTSIAGTLGVAGAANLTSTLTAQSVSCSGNLTSTAGNLVLYGNIIQSQSAATSTLAGNLTIAGTTTLNGNAIFNSGIQFTGTTTFSDINVNGAAVFSSTITASGTIFTTANLTASGNLTIAGNAALNGNTTIGNAGGDLLTINSANVTVPGVPAKTVPVSADSVLIVDSADSNKVKKSPASAFLATLFPQSNSSLLNTNTSITSSSTSFGTEIVGLRTSITPRSASSKVLVTIMINYGAGSGSSKLASFRLTRNGTEIGQTASGTGSSLDGIAPCVFTDGVDQINNTFIQFWDSPSSASAVEYRIHAYNKGATTATLYINYSSSDNGGGAADRCRCSSNMVLQEYFA
jgi:hypothetical protein